MRQSETRIFRTFALRIRCRWIVCVCAQTRSIRLQPIQSRSRNMQLKLLNMSKSDWITRKNSQIHFVLQKTDWFRLVSQLLAGVSPVIRLRYRQFGANSHPRPEKRLDYTVLHLLRRCLRTRQTKCNIFLSQQKKKDSNYSVRIKHGTQRQNSRGRIEPALWCSLDESKL